MYLGQCVYIRFFDLLDRSEVSQQCTATGGPDARNVFQCRMHGSLPAKAPVIGDRKTVRLIAHMLDQVQRGGTSVKQDRLLGVRQPQFFLALCTNTFCKAFSVCSEER